MVTGDQVICSSLSASSTSAAKPRIFVQADRGAEASSSHTAASCGIELLVMEIEERKTTIQKVRCAGVRGLAARLLLSDPHTRSVSGHRASRSGRISLPEPPYHLNPESAKGLLKALAFPADAPANDAVPLKRDLRSRWVSSAPTAAISWCSCSASGFRRLQSRAY